MFDYDWFNGLPFRQQRQDARWRCAQRRFPEADRSAMDDNQEVRSFMEELVVRSLLYLRDGFSYEFKEMAGVDSKNHLTFECEPVDEHYKVGSFVVAVPFDEIVRVEVFAVHPSERPEDMPLITGFSGRPEGPERPREAAPPQ